MDWMWNRNENKGRFYIFMLPLLLLSSSSSSSSSKGTLVVSNESIGNFVGLFDGGSLLDGVIPALDVRVLWDIRGLVVFAGGVYPGVSCDVGDGEEVSGHILVGRKLLVEDLEDALALGPEPVDRVGNVLLGVLGEVAKLAEIGSQARHLPH